MWSASALLIVRFSLVRMRRDLFQAMNKILIIEDMRSMANVLSSMIKLQWQYDCDCVATYKEAESLLAENAQQYFVAIVDLHLPDAPNGEAIELVMGANIPVLCFTAQFSEALREDIWAKGVADYTLKQAQGVEYVVYMVERLRRNRTTKVLIVDDSRVSRNSIANTLRQQCFQTFVAESGETALDLIEQHPDIKIVLIDTYMEPMDGFAVTRKIREKFSRDRMGIVGMSSQGNSILSAKFIKYGANDFIVKPFLQEEFFCRINQMADYLERVQQLTDINQQKNKIMGMAAHDLRGPLSGIISASQMLDRAVAKPERLPYLIDTIRSSATHMLAMINSMLDVATIERGDFELEKRPNCLSTIVQDCLRFWTFRAEEKGISINSQLSPLPASAMDGAKIRQVCDNMISNALKYSPPNTQVDVKCHANENMLVMEVIDSGSGIKAEQIQHLFKPFSRVGTKTTGGEGSIGLGLAICKTIMEKHGGNIEYAPREDGQSGSVFRITIPV